MISSVHEIRACLRSKLLNEVFVTDKTGSKTIEIVGASFIANEPSLFGTPNPEYIKAEIEWYESQSKNVNTLAEIYGKRVAIWDSVSGTTGYINSNYGWCIYSSENGDQYNNVFNELRTSPESRRAVMIYTNPWMHTYAFKNGMSDFMCTNTVQYVIRDNRLRAIVNMRSNDAVFGYNNDHAWQMHVLRKLASDLEIGYGPIVWQVGSLHLYERHFALV